MTEKRANEILRTKYPEATIYNGKRYGGATSSNMVVVFKKGGKAYNYYATTYQQVLEKLGFNILYKHNVEAYERTIKKLEEEIEAGGFESLFADEEGFIKYSDDEILKMKSEIERIKNELKTSIIV